MISLSPSPQRSDLSSEGLRYAMRQLASGVSVITTGLAPNRTGFTATSVASLSVDPPRLSFAVNKTSSTYLELACSGVFAVNFLRAHQELIANRFAGRVGAKGEERFKGSEWTSMLTGASVLTDALAAIDCELEELVERHSYAIAIGRVMAVRSVEAGGALIYWRGGYDGLHPASAAA